MIYSTPVNRLSNTSNGYAIPYFMFHLISNLKPLNKNFTMEMLYAHFCYQALDQSALQNFLIQMS